MASVTLSIAGLNIGIESEDKSIAANISKNWHKFVVKENPDWTFCIERVRSLRAFDAILCRWDQERFQVKRKAVWLDGDATTQQIKLVVSYVYGIGDILRLAVGILLVYLGGFLLHGAAILGKDGKTGVFYGKSGSGKSTVSKLAEKTGRIILTDESIAILPFGSSFKAWATPFYGELGRVSKNLGGEIAFMARIYHGQENQLTPFSSRELFLELVQNVFFFAGNRFAVERFFDNVEALSQAVNGYRFDFLPTAEIWNYLNGYFEANLCSK